MRGKISKLKPIEFEWDRGNIDKNWEKRRVDFRECEQMFFNKPLKIFYDKKHSQKENRFLAYGATNRGRRLTVVFTQRNKKIRVISARDQNRKEKKIYEKK